MFSDPYYTWHHFLGLWNEWADETGFPKEYLNIFCQWPSIHPFLAKKPPSLRFSGCPEGKKIQHWCPYTCKHTHSPHLRISVSHADHGMVRPLPSLGSRGFRKIQVAALPFTRQLRPQVERDIIQVLCWALPVFNSIINTPHIHVFVSSTRVGAIPLTNAKYHLASGMCTGHLQPVYSRVCWHFFLQSYEILTGGTQEALRKTKIPAQPLSNCVILTNYSIVQNFIFLIWKWC